jgi:hypothetical protein
MLEQRSDPCHHYKQPPPQATCATAAEGGTVEEGDRDKGSEKAKKSWSWGWRSESEDGEVGNG